MDPDIMKSLAIVQAKKQSLNAELKLSKDCDSLIQLDQRVDELLSEVRSLHHDVDHHHQFISHNQDKLSTPCHTLQKINDILDLFILLAKLNRLCRRIDSNPNLQHSPTGELSIRCTIPISKLSENEENEDVLAIKAIQDLIEDFEKVYRLLEDYMSKRLDLPYISYATMVRNLREHLEKSGFSFRKSPTEINLR